MKRIGTSSVGVGRLSLKIPTIVRNGDSGKKVWRIFWFSFVKEESWVNIRSCVC